MHLMNSKRFDCIAFEQDSVDSSKIYIKRVVGLPGNSPDKGWQGIY